MSLPLRLSVLGLVVLTLAGCAEHRLGAVPAGDTERASVLGISDARLFLDDTAGFTAQYKNLHDRETSYFASHGGPLPPRTYLALSGGGDQAAFGAGLLVGLSESGKRPFFSGVTGVSGGALVAPFAYLGPDYDPILKELFANLRQSEVLKERSVIGALVSDAMADSEPLRRLIAKYVDAKMVSRIADEYRHGRVLAIMTTDLDAGVPVAWNIGAIAESGHPEAVALIQKILLASASIPAVYPPVMFDVNINGVNYQEMHVDGGAAMQTFIYPPTFQLPPVSAAEAQRIRTVYVIRNGRLRAEWHETPRSTISIATRAVAALIASSGVSDLYRIYATTKRDSVGFRLAYINDDFVVSHPGDEFDQHYMVQLFEYARAKAHSGGAWQDAPPGF